MAGTSETLTDQRALIAECVNERVWAVVGASTNPAKWGHRLYAALKASGYQVYPVNPRALMIDGDRCYPSLAALPEPPAVVDVVVPPAIGLMIAEEAAATGISRIWFQPGAESPENIARARALGLKTVAYACALAERKHHWD
jgi:predicted CoA-binding protein